MVGFCQIWNTVLPSTQMTCTNLYGKFKVNTVNGLCWNKITLQWTQNNEQVHANKQLISTNNTSNKHECCILGNISTSSSHHWYFFEQSQNLHVCKFCVNCVNLHVFLKTAQSPFLIQAALYEIHIHCFPSDVVICVLHSPHGDQCSLKYWNLHLSVEDTQLFEC